MRARQTAFAAIFGYLTGSISFARIIGRRVAPGRDLYTTSYRITGDDVLVSRGVSASAVGVRAGRRWGCLTAALDIGKALLPTLACARLAPHMPAAPAAAAGALVGHAFPFHHGFRGGFGQSPILGAMVVLDPAALPVAIAGGIGAGLALGDGLMAFEGWPLFLVPLAMRRRDRGLLAYVLLANAIYWWRMWPEVRQRIELQRRRPRPWRERLGEIRHGYL